MSTNKDTAGKEDNEVSVCANCGKGEEESDKLKACTACTMVKYCNRECQIAHRKQHKKECRKRAAEIHDEKLFNRTPGIVNRYLFLEKDTTNKIAYLLSKSWRPHPSRKRRR